MAGFSVMDMMNANSVRQAGLEEWYKDTGYEEAKEIIRDELGNIRNSFIQVGYFLRRIRETEGYKKDGYGTIWEFAEEQYGITRTTTSRWMEINRRFSEDGYSPYLAEEYKEYSKSQLQEMLYLPEERLEEVSPEMTIKEIREKGKEEPSAIPHAEEENTCDKKELEPDESLEPAADEKSREIQQMAESEGEQEQNIADSGQQEAKESRSIREQKTENVTDTMTSEEDQENAKKLHILKMLEKYYIYLNQEETDILKDILEDCKRRKREYGFEDCGETNNTRI